jgi:hypothetical protein
MKFLRFEHNGKPGYGVLESDGVIRVYQGDMFAASRPTSATLKLSDVKLLIPCVP